MLVVRQNIIFEMLLFYPTYKICVLGLATRKWKEYANEYMNIYFIWKMEHFVFFCFIWNNYKQKKKKKQKYFKIIETQSAFQTTCDTRVE